MVNSNILVGLVTGGSSWKDPGGPEGKVFENVLVGGVNT